MKLFVTLLALLPVWLHAEPVVRAQWQYSAPVAGEPVTLQLAAEGLPEVYGIQLEMVISGAPVPKQAPFTRGSFWGIGESMELKNVGEADGRVEWIFSLLRPASPVGGSGELAQLTLEPDQAALLSVASASVKFGTRSGEVIRPKLELPEKPLRIYASREDVPGGMPAWLLWSMPAVVVIVLVGLFFLRKRKSGVAQDE